MSSIFDRVPDLAAWVAAADIDVLVLKGPDGSLRLERAPNGSVVVADRPAHDGPQAASGGAATKVRATLAGSFLTRHPVRADRLVEMGDRVAAGQAIGLVQVGDLLAPVCAPHDGVVEAVIAEGGALVGYGDPLFWLARS
ncbi:biotin attachment protein [Alsobacter metallidurans]|uniref:Biotin attachment protein n=1 Tax=Alsobacter metallidurans TaxID=340221 RepID=A0A917I2X3_9HYPH|nr:biotin/lipoyl-containing protein [Alsobacter metallidurans]GGH07124.1 biotin attachment protein [Alsobacter metallidurans]